MADLSPQNDELRFILINSYSAVQADQVADLHPPEKSKYRSILIDYYTESSGREGGRSSDRSIFPPRKWQFDIHTVIFLL